MSITSYCCISLLLAVVSVATTCHGLRSVRSCDRRTQRMSLTLQHTRQSTKRRLWSKDASDMDNSNVTGDDMAVERERQRLEDWNTQSFLKKRTRKLPYEAARKWIQGNLGASTKEEFMDLVENGNVRTPYIPKRPDEYYAETREWISWDHFLTGIFDDEQPSTVRPKTGVFD